MAIERIVSGIKPTLNLFNNEYDLKLSNWISMQHENECLFFVADLHSLATRNVNSEFIVDVQTLNSGMYFLNSLSAA